jgi:Flp pilus assembly protein TadG
MSKLSTCWRVVQRRLTPRKYLKDRRGAAAIEFAFIVPIAMTLFTAALTYSDAIYISRKVTLTAHTVTDLVTQYPTLTLAQITTIIGASSAVIAPYSSTNLVVVVSEVQTNAAGAATITWSNASSNGTARTVGAPVALPLTISTPNATYIWGEAYYTYTPTIGYMVMRMIGSLTLSDQTFMAPRVSANIPKPS